MLGAERGARAELLLLPVGRCTRTLGARCRSGIVGWASLWGIELSGLAVWAGCEAVALQLGRRRGCILALRIDKHPGHSA